MLLFSSRSAFLVLSCVAEGELFLHDQFPPSPATVINSAIPNLSCFSSSAKGTTFVGCFKNGVQLGHCDRNENGSPNISPTSTSVTIRPPTGPSLTGTEFLASSSPPRSAASFVHWF